MSRIRGAYASPQLQVDRNVDDITCPPRPDTWKSTHAQTKWRERHRGLLRRAQTLPSNTRIATVCGLAIAIAVVPWVIVRRWIVCPISYTPSALCRYSWGIVNFSRGVGFVVLLVAFIVLLRKWYWMSRLRRELAHLSPAQRRLLGLPELVNHPDTAARTRGADGTPAGGKTPGQRGVGRTPGTGKSGRRTPLRPWMKASLRARAIAGAASANASAAAAPGSGGGVGSGGGMRAAMGGMGSPAGLTRDGEPEAGPFSVAAGASFGTPLRTPGSAMAGWRSGSSRLRARQLGLEGRSHSAIQDRRQLSVFLREQSMRAEVEGDEYNASSPGRSQALASMAGGGFGMSGYAGSAGGFGGGYQANGEGFYEYAPGFSYDTSTRASSVAGVAWNNMQAAEELLTSLELAKEQMDAFTENLRKYLAKYIQDKVFKILDWNVEQLVRRGFNREFLLGQVELGANDNFDGKMRLDEMIHSKSLQTTRYIATMPNGDQVQLWKQRSQIEAFFDLSRGGDKRYVMHRLQVLCRDGYLGHFQWDGGGTWNGQKWTAERPSDAQLILHVFTTMMDRLLGSHLTSEVQPFRNRYTHTGPKMPPKDKLARRHPMLHIVSTVPPHVRVIAGNKPRPIVEGRENVFQAVIIFLYYVHKEEKDRLGSVDVRRLTRRVLTAVEPGYDDGMYLDEY